MKERRFDKVHGTTRAAFHAIGKFPRVKEQLTIEVIIGLCGPVHLWTLWTCGLCGPVDPWTLWTCGLCGPLYLRERTYFLILFGLLPFETMSVIPPFGNNLGKLCIETEVIYSSVMTYTVLRYLQKQPPFRSIFSPV